MRDTTRIALRTMLLAALCMLTTVTVCMGQYGESKNPEQNIKQLRHRPNHNARGDYYGVVGDYTRSWKHVPKDLIIMCWYYKIRNESPRFFSGQGFRTFGASYYDADDLTNPRQWLSSLRSTPEAQGIMYTTWEKKYRLLPEFARLVSGTTAVHP
jgi:hypothetical protein